ncbi:MAG: 16S rRNA (guanine(527)-N(7))-methyltransferase RsmG [candidate division Zixibacteria bacterium]|nr:16S rRNA (guanine(527)-N(7))-methyltransferase RsmG [candidate division Zixibacteria bacterium]
MLENKGTLWNIQASTDQLNRLDKYISLLITYSQKFNLISKNDITDIFNLHILDSLEALAHIPKHIGLTLLDVGSGAGLPGIPISIVLTGCNIILLEKSSKKCEFLKSIKTKLSLDNISIINETIEDFSKHENHCIDILLFRAVKSFPECRKLSKTFLERGAGLIYFNKRSGTAGDKFIIHP